MRKFFIAMWKKVTKYCPSCQREWDDLEEDAYHECHVCGLRLIKR